MTSPGTLDGVPEPPPQRSDLRLRLRALLREVGKFGAVGGIAFLIDLALYNVLLQAGSETVLAKTLSTVVATTIAFLGNRFWTWRDGRHSHPARQVVIFFALNAVGLGITVSCLAISHYGLGQIWPALQTPLADNIAGPLVGTGLGTMFRFWSYRRFVFRATEAPATSVPGDTGSVTSPSSALRDSA